MTQKKLANVYISLSYIYLTHTQSIKSHCENRFPWLSRHSSIALGKSSRLHPVSVQSCWRYVFGQPKLTHSCEGVHRRTSLMSLCLLLQLCPACLVCFIWMVLEIGGTWLCNLFCGMLLAGFVQSLSVCVYIYIYMCSCMGQHPT